MDRPLQPPPAKQQLVLQKRSASPLPAPSERENTKGQGEPTLQVHREARPQDAPDSAKSDKELTEQKPVEAKPVKQAPQVKAKPVKQPHVEKEKELSYESITEQVAHMRHIDVDEASRMVHQAAVHQGVIFQPGQKELRKLASYLGVAEPV